MDEVVESSDVELTNDVVALKITSMNWSYKIVNLLASRLLPMYKVLHKILIHNLDPTHHSRISHVIEQLCCIKLHTKVGLGPIKLDIYKDGL